MTTEGRIAGSGMAIPRGNRLSCDSVLQALCRRAGRRALSPSPASGEGGKRDCGDGVASEIRIANDISEIARVADLVDSFGESNQLPNEVVFALNVSLDEILNNIISYGYEDAGRHDILVRLELRSGIVDVIVEDDGKPFDPLLVPAPDLSAKLRLGGVGLHFVRNLMDGLEYARRDGINRLRMMKNASLKQAKE
jgi:serine/threonine-protein kinase RsbW